MFDMKKKQLEKVSLGSLLTLKKGKKPKKQSPVKEKGMQPYVDIKAFETGVIDNYTDDDKCLPCNDGDLLIVCDGSRSGYVGRAIKGYTGSTLAKISAEGVDNSYLYYFIQSMYRLLNTQMKGTGTPHLNVDVLRKAELVIPSLKEQKRIVDKIEELFSELDSAVETLKKTKEQLAVYRQSVLKEAFDENFETVLFGTIMQSRLGKMLDAAKNIGKPQKYLRNINVRWLGFDLGDLQEMKIEDSEHDKYLLKNGDLIMCEGGEPGRCAVWDKGDGMFFQKALHRIRFNGEENPKFYMYYFLLLAQSDGLKKYFTGSGIKHLTGQSLVKIVVPVAPLKKQNEVIKKIESQFSVCENIEKTVNDALIQADAMRQSILKKAFEGEL